MPCGLATISSCFPHPDQLRRRVEAHHCEPTSPRWPPEYSIPFSSFSLTQRVITLRRTFTINQHVDMCPHLGYTLFSVCKETFPDAYLFFFFAEHSASSED